MTELQEAPALEAIIAQEKQAVASIRDAVNAIRRRLHLPEQDYTNVSVGAYR